MMYSTSLFYSGACREPCPSSNTQEDPTRIYPCRCSKQSNGDQYWNSSLSLVSYQQTLPIVFGLANPGKNLTCVAWSTILYPVFNLNKLQLLIPMRSIPFKPPALDFLNMIHMIQLQIFMVNRWLEIAFSPWWSGTNSYLQQSETTPLWWFRKYTCGLRRAHYCMSRWWYICDKWSGTSGYKNCTALVSFLSVCTNICLLTSTLSLWQLVYIHTVHVVTMTAPLYSLQYLSYSIFQRQTFYF